MNKNTETDKILDSMVLPNGIRVTLYDLSKKIAADRWLVKVKCEAVLQVHDDWFDSLADAEMAAAMKQDCAHGVQHTLLRERNFVDEKEKDAILQELFDQLSENAKNYMGGDLFSRKLFAKKADDFKLKYRMQKELEGQTAVDEDDDGPADFSAYFRD